MEENELHLYGENVTDAGTRRAWHPEIEFVKVGEAILYFPLNM